MRFAGASSSSAARTFPPPPSCTADQSTPDLLHRQYSHLLPPTTKLTLTSSNNIFQTQISKPLPENQPESRIFPMGANKMFQLPLREISTPSYILPSALRNDDSEVQMKQEAASLISNDMSSSANDNSGKDPNIHYWINIT